MESWKAGTLRRDRRDFIPASVGTIYLLANADVEFSKTGVELARITRPGARQEVQSGRTLFIYFTQD